MPKAKNSIPNIMKSVQIGSEYRYPISAGKKRNNEKKDVIKPTIERTSLRRREKITTVSQ